MKLNKARQLLADKFVKSLKEKEIPWYRGWITLNPVSCISGKEYRGINSFLLALVASEKGYSDPRWCTYKQAKENEWQVKKGEKGTPIEFWSLYDLKTKQKITNKESEELLNKIGREEHLKRVKPISQVYTVFNAEQIQGVPEYLPVKEPLDQEMFIRLRDRLITNMSLSFQEGGERVFYRISEDRLTMPSINRFQSVYSYMSIFLHECGHATGHESRLKRKMCNMFGSEEYAREELRAEIASAFTSQAFGFTGDMDEQHMENHKAYIQSWAKVIANNPNELFSAIHDAAQISDYLIDKSEIKKEFGLAEDREQEEINIDGNIVCLGSFEFDEDNYLHFSVEADGYGLEGLFRIYDPENGKDMSLVSIDYGYEHPLIKRGWELIENQLKEKCRDQYEAIRKQKIPLFSVQQIAKIRLAIKGRSVETFLQSAGEEERLAYEVGRSAVALLTESTGWNMKNIIRDRILDLDKKFNLNNPGYVKNLLCSVFIRSMEEYHEMLGDKVPLAEMVQQKGICRK